MRQFLIFIFLLATGVCHSQTQSLYREDFTDNKDQWLIKNDEVTKTEVKEDNYVITMKKDGWWWISYNSFSINHRSPFKIVTSFKFASGSSSSQFGVLWDCEDINNNRIFAVKKSGYYTVMHYSAGKEDMKKEWAKTTIKVGDGNYHRLTLHYNGTKNLYYIDSVLVAETEAWPFDVESGIGFYFHSKSSIYINHVELFQDRGPMNVVEGDFAGTKKENLGSNVNTIHTEKHPVISHDGKTLYFIREGDAQNIGENKEYEDVWYSGLDENGSWGKAMNIGAPVNNDSHNGVVAVAADNSWMVVKHVYDEKGKFKEAGFSICYREGNGWSMPKKLEVDNYYNDARYVEASMSPDGEVLVLCIERKDTHGEKDIYFSKKKADGSFSEPVNCGGVINTFADEIGPFMAADGITMYYASEGLPGYGSADVYMTRRLDDSWTNWSTPVNLGPAINGKGWDAYFSTDSKGKWAYMISDENSIGSLDIFRIELPEKARPIPLCVIKGIVYNSKTSQPMLAEITYKMIENDSLINKQFTNPGDGKFGTVLRGGFHYSIMANYAGYVGERVNIDLADIEEHAEKEVVLYLKPIEKDQSIHLNNVFFEEDKAELHYNSKAELYHVYNLMKQYPKMKILIGGHAMGGDGDAKVMQKLSEERAKVVYKFLVDLGIDKKRLQYKGYGKDKPVGTTSTMAGNSQNRCVEFTILEI